MILFDELISSSFFLWFVGDTECILPAFCCISNSEYPRLPCLNLLGKRFWPAASWFFRHSLVFLRKSRRRVDGFDETARLSLMLSMLTFCAKIGCCVSSKPRKLKLCLLLRCQAALLFLLTTCYCWSSTRWELWCSLSSSMSSLEMRSLWNEIVSRIYSTSSLPWLLVPAAIKPLLIPFLSLFGSYCYKLKLWSLPVIAVQFFLWFLYRFKSFVTHES